MNRLKSGMFAEIPKKEESTIGISIDSWNPAEDFEKYSIPNADNLITSIVQEDESPDITDASIRFSLFDFAGQEHYHGESGDIILCLHDTFVSILIVRI